MTVNQSHDPEPLGQDVKRKEANYENKSSKYIIKQTSYERQYFHYYSNRMQLMRDKLTKAAKVKWGQDITIIQISDCKNEDFEVYIIGMIFKHMDLQYRALREFSQGHNIATQPIRQRYRSDSDKLFIEDEMHRFPINPSDLLKVDDMVTGVLVALKGRVEAGCFNVMDVCFVDMPNYIERPVPEEEKYVILVSGLALAKSVDSAKVLPLLVNLLEGNFPSYETDNFVRLIIAGNALSRSIDIPVALDKLLHRQTAAGSVEGGRILDDFLKDLTASMFVDVMPGDEDPASVLLPQQPFVRAMFPKSCQTNGLNLVSNPYEFSIDGTRFLGTSGQNINSIYDYSGKEDPLEIMESTLRWGHIMPTTPDLLFSYPFLDNDPFVLNSRPHVYFAGNQPKYATKVFSDSNGQPVRLISLPPFYKQPMCVRLSLRNLQCSPIYFGTNF